MVEVLTIKTLKFVIRLFRITISTMLRKFHLHVLAKASHLRLKVGATGNLWKASLLWLSIFMGRIMVVGYSCTIDVLVLYSKESDPLKSQ